MQDAETYRQYAAECSKLALSMPRHRKELEDMAAAWSALAAAAATQRAKTDGKSDGKADDGKSVGND
jgi:hypothetical protein